MIPLKVQNTVEPALIQKITTLTFIVIWLVMMLYLLSLLPGMDRIIPQTPITVVAIVAAIVTAVIVGLLLSLAPKIATALHDMLSGTEPLIEHASSVVYWAIILLAVLIAHRGFAGVVVPFFDEMVWLYDSIFLILALPAVICIGFRLYLMVEPGSKALSMKVGDDTAADPE